MPDACHGVIPFARAGTRVFRTIGFRSTSVCVVRFDELCPAFGHEYVGIPLRDVDHIASVHPRKIDSIDGVRKFSNDADTCQSPYPMMSRPRQRSSGAMRCVRSRSRGSAHLHLPEGGGAVVSSVTVVNPIRHRAETVFARQAAPYGNLPAERA